MYSYPSIYALGHKAVRDIFLDPVLIEEKVDGSQFSFGIGLDEELKCRSKGADINMYAPEKMFKSAVETVQALKAFLKPGWVYRCEYLARPKHNALSYSRIPMNHLILFDVSVGPGAYLSYEEKEIQAERLGLEVVPRLFEGIIDSPEDIRSFLDRDSILGGVKIEGVVVKNYLRFGVDKHILLGKFVSEAFKEVHNQEWTKSNPKTGDILDQLVSRYHSQARWQKAVQHLTEQGVLLGEPKDIGELFKEVPADIRRECEQDIRDALFAWAWPRIQRGATAGLAEWYKDRLLKAQFGDEGRP